MEMQASVKNIGRLVQRMPSAQLLPELQSPGLLPGLFEAFDHHSADVRKAVTMCLMYLWFTVFCLGWVQVCMYRHMHQLALLGVPMDCEHAVCRAVVFHAQAAKLIYALYEVSSQPPGQPGILLGFSLN